MMRSTVEIIADIKNGKEVPYEELKLACLVQSFIIHQYQNDVKNLFKGGISAELTRSGWYSDPEKSSAEGGISTVYWNGMKSDPEKFLGPRWIPGTPEWQAGHAACQKIYDAVMKKTKAVDC